MDGLVSWCCCVCRCELRRDDASTGNEGSQDRLGLKDFSGQVGELPVLAEPMQIKGLVVESQLL